MVDEKQFEIGRYSKDALELAKSIVKEGARLVDVADTLEKFFSDKGLQFAFPANISVNDTAAHYAPEKDDKRTFGRGDVVKVDIGARYNDYLTDCAVTIDLSGENGKLIEASERALESAISMVKAGRAIGEIGKEVERIAKESGFQPIRNLGGHGLKPGDIHADIFIPNYDNGDRTVLQEGEHIAIETFITNGAGYVVEGEHMQIFRKFGAAATRMPDAREVGNYIDSNYGTYPFALRWLLNKFDSEFKVRSAISELMRLDAIEGFPVLIEKAHGIVAQTERDMIVEKDSCRLVTPL